MYFTGIDPFRKQAVYIARNLQDRKCRQWATGQIETAGPGATSPVTAETVHASVKP
jgi:hypothetical protein